VPSPLNILRRVRRYLSSPSLRVAVYPKISWYWKLLGFGGLVGLMVIFGWVSFDIGRQSAGFDRSVAKATEVDLTSRIGKLEEHNIELGRKAVNLEGKLKMALSAQNKVSREMGALTDENNRLKEEVVFFETLMTSGQEPGGVSVARFEVNSLSTPGEFEYRILIVQSQQRVKEFNGFFSLITYFKKPSGDKDDIVQVSGPKANDLRFKFYQRAIGRFRLPEGGQLVSVEARVFKDGMADPLVTRQVKFNELVN